MNNLLNLEKVGKNFGRRQVFKDVSLELAPGGIVALTGPNGSGKSTLIKIAIGLIRATRGSVRVFSVDPHKDPSIRRRIGYLGHELGLYDELSAEENLAFYAGLMLLPAPASRIRAALETVDLFERSGDRVRDFSRGMKERLALARVTLNDPDLYLLDEPTTGLDTASVAVLIELVRSWVGRSKGIVVTTHDRSLADRLGAVEFCLDRSS